MSDTVYQLTAPEQKRWLPNEGRFEPVDPYTSPRPIFGVTIKDGHGTTTNRKTALEFFDMGYAVEPDPHVPDEDDVDGEELEVVSAEKTVARKAKAKK